MFLRLVSNLVEDLIRWPSGPLGNRVRRFWYSRRLSACGSGLLIEPGVHILGAGYISLGDNVWLDRGVILIAGPPRSGARIVAGAVGEGRLEIGNDCHLGPGTIIQAHGGARIGDCFTASAGAKIYTFSNDPAECRAGTTEFGRNDPGYRVTPVEIGRNVWLGLDTVVIGGRLADNCFLRPQALLLDEVPAGQVAGGVPARPLRPRFPEAS
jgi:acetyltransferase-like isoleucine patch superfamily enzyme